MTVITMIGFVAAFCTTWAFLPQVIKTVRTRDTSSISLGMYIVFILGLISWLVYGILKADIPIVTANVITLVLCSIVLILKIRHG